MNFEEIVQSIQKRIPQVNINILQFIHNILTHCGNHTEQNEGIYELFASGYCYYFAKILQTAFPGGTIVWCAPYGHIAYQYQDIVYDAHYVYDGEAEIFIPVDNMGDTIQDFLHIPNIAHHTTQEEITQMMENAKHTPISNYHITCLSKSSQSETGYRYKIYIKHQQEIAAILYLTNHNDIITDIQDDHIPETILEQAKNQLKLCMTPPSQHPAETALLDCYQELCQQTVSLTMFGKSIDLLPITNLQIYIEQHKHDFYNYENMQQPKTCIHYKGVSCCYPIQDCKNCPMHEPQFTTCQFE